MSAGGLVRRIDAIGGREARWCGGAVVRGVFSKKKVSP
jgi:hypothetical protein